MIDQHEETERRGFRWVVAFLVALPFLYVLSTGPVALYVRKGLPDQAAIDWIVWFYAPIGLIGQKTPFGTLLQVYVDWWVSLIP